MSLDKVTVFKMKETVTEFGDFIRTADAKNRPLPALQPLNLPDDLVFDGEVQVAAAFKPHISRNKTQHDIPWLAFINEGRPADDQFTFNSRNRFPCAVVAIRITVEGQDSFFAVTFGLGAEGFLKPSAVVRDFGIRVAMNICDREKLRRVQTSIHESVSTQSEKQISVGSSFSVFNIDDEKEFLRAISGAAKPGYEYIKSFTGKESIAIKNDKDNPVNWHNIIPRIQALNLAYGQDEYKEKRDYPLDAGICWPYIITIRGSRETPNLPPRPHTLPERFSELFSERSKGRNLLRKNLFKSICYN